MWIMIAGRYRSGTLDEKRRQDNLDAMNRVAYELFRKGHIPVIGVNLALPIIKAVGEDHYNELMMPISLAATERCDAILRIGGISSGADDEVARFRARGLPVYKSLDEVPNERDLH